MSSLSDLEREFKKEIEIHRSQQVIIKALMKVKELIGYSNPNVVSLINRIYLANNMKLNQEQVGSLFGFGTEISREPIAAIDRAKIMNHVTTQVDAQCSEVIVFVREKKTQEKLNVFEIENIKRQIEDLMKQYNEKLDELIRLKEDASQLEAIAVDLKASGAQRRQLEIDSLEVQELSSNVEYLHQHLTAVISDQVPGNAEALLKLNEFINKSPH